MAVDFDKAGAAEGAATLHRELLLAGLRPVTCDSGGWVDGSGEPRRHTFVRVRPGDDRTVRARAKELGGDVRLAIRPPFSAHRLGHGWSTPVLPSDPGEVLKRLEAALVPNRLPVAISRWIYEEIAEKGSRSTVVLQVASALAVAGWTREEMLLLLDSPDLAISTTYGDAREDRSHPGDTWFTEQIWPAAAAFAERRLNTRTVVGAIRPRLSELVGPGRTHASDMKVMNALLDLAEALNTMAVSVSLRELGERAGVGSRTTLVASLRRLQERDVIRRGEPGASSDLPPDVVGVPAIYEIVQPDDLDEAEGVWGTSAAGDPAFRYGYGLGPGAGLVYDAIVRAPGSPSIEELVVITGLSDGVVHKGLARLVNAGLLASTVDGWAPTGTSPSDVAAAGAVEAATRQRKRNQAERQLRLAAIRRATRHRRD